jgi:hypothetical protein
LEIVNGKDYSSDIHVDRRIILKVILEIGCEGVDCLMTGKSGRLL